MEEELLKLPPTIPAELLAQVLESLWRTRETGLASPDKARIQSLLNLPTPQHLGPVLACLRSIIRKCVNEKLAGENIQNVLPHDLPAELRNVLALLLRKYQNQWMAEATKDQPLWQKPRVSDQVKINRPPPFASSTASELSSLLWPREDDATTYPKSSNTPSNVVANLPSSSSMPHNQDHGSLDGLTTLPRLKSMTWTMEKRNSAPANRLAIITLKLQDYSKSSSGEIEVKFQLSKDSLEAMLRSMTHLAELLSNSAASPSEPSAKKQKQ
uniref:Uncharacterized protein n=1 Tax=Ananas comosus var. bracteatus TaxID=296719 RepID=A0A6V7NFN0_ANACO|nr:unnamed protein product [Ananas comosus var. bracteatus]